MRVHRAALSENVRSGVICLAATTGVGAGRVPGETPLPLRRQSRRMPGLHRESARSSSCAPTPKRPWGSCDFTRSLGYRDIHSFGASMTRWTAEGLIRKVGRGTYMLEQGSTSLDLTGRVTRQLRGIGMGIGMGTEGDGRAMTRSSQEIDSPGSSPLTPSSGWSRGPVYPGGSCCDDADSGDARPTAGEARMAEVYLRRLSRWQAEQQRAAVADLHVTAYRGTAGAEYRDRQGFLDRFERHVQRTGFDMVVAEAAGLVGCAYGFRVARTGEWWSGFRGELPTDIEELTASGRTFLLAGLMVLPAHRRLGVATLVGERLLTRLDADLVVAAVDRERLDVDRERPDDEGSHDEGSHDGEGGHGEGLGGGGRPANAAEETLRAWGWSRLGVLGPRTRPEGGSGSGSGTGSDSRAGAGVGSGRGGAVREVWIRRPLR